MRAFPSIHCKGTSPWKQEYVIVGTLLFHIILHSANLIYIINLFNIVPIWKENKIMKILLITQEIDMLSSTRSTAQCIVASKLPIYYQNYSLHDLRLVSDAILHHIKQLDNIPTHITKYQWAVDNLIKSTNTIHYSKLLTRYSPVKALTLIFDWINTLDWLNEYI